MKRLSCALRFAAALAVSATLIPASDGPPAGPFEVIHYFQINGDRGPAERAMLEAMAELNKGISEGAARRASTTCGRSRASANT
jgi:hypothetical protein